MFPLTIKPVRKPVASSSNQSDSNNTDWVYVVVQASAENEMFLGQHDDESDISFIPVFRHKDDANQCLPLMAKDPAMKYEVQAIHKDDLFDQAADTGFHLYLLDGGGVILNKVNPADNSGT